MKLLQINVVYGRGSTGKIVKDIHHYLKENSIESIVYYGRGKKISDKDIHKVTFEWIMKLQSLRSRITGYAYGGCWYSTTCLIHFIKKEKPDVVHLHCLNGYFVNIYRLIDFLKKNHIKTVLTLHAEFMYTAGCAYAEGCEQWMNGCERCPNSGGKRPPFWIWNRCKKEWCKMEKAMRDFEDLIICPVSDCLKANAQQSPFMKNKRIITVNNGIDTTIFYYRRSESLKKKIGITDEKLLLHVTPNFYSELKGGRYVLELAELIKASNDRVKVIIVGYNGSGDDLTETIIPIKHTENQEELAAFYSMADVTLLTSKSETFSMVTAESLCCGTPVVGFKAGGPENIAIDEYSKFSNYGNIKILLENVWDFLKLDLDKEKVSACSRKRYNKETMCDRYLNLYS